MAEAVTKSTFSAKIACDLIRYAGEKGASANLLFRHLGLEKRYRNRDDIRVPAEKMASVWMLAHKLTSDPFLAFHMGVDFSHSARHTHLMIMQSSVGIIPYVNRGEVVLLDAGGLILKIRTGKGVSAEPYGSCLGIISAVDV